ncbi:LacI family DNA-binding transcriptional regulator [Alicyclobacillus curvatus]|nr:LacI family DNA-binding transcriptional regulator [Alicyclobacillus curvatus]
MATMRDIAERANVSTSVVSRILSQDGTLSVAESTRERVLDAANELNYQVKKKVKRGKQIVGQLGIVLFHSQDHSRERDLEDPYFPAIRRGIELECQKRGLPHPVTQYWSSEGLVPNEQLRACEAIIFIGVEDMNATKLLPSDQRHMFVDYAPEPDKYSSIVVNFQSATETVVNHLLGLGHRQIGLIVGSHTYGVDARQACFESILGRQGLFRPEAVFVTDWTLNGGYRAMMEALAKPNVPSAFFVASDPMAIGAIKALQDAGKRVPEDVAIVGFDDIEMAGFVTPALTTVRINTELMGRLAVRLCDAPLDEVTPLTIVLPFELVVRDSCGTKSNVSQ